MNMTLPDYRKRAIDAMTIDQLLYDHRFAPAGDPRFQGAEGDYRIKRLTELRRMHSASFVAASKSIGWRKEGSA